MPQKLKGIHIFLEIRFSFKKYEGEEQLFFFKIAKVSHKKNFTSKGFFPDFQ